MLTHTCMHTTHTLTHSNLLHNSNSFHHYIKHTCTHKNVRLRKRTRAFSFSLSLSLSFTHTHTHTNTHTHTLTHTHTQQLTHLNLQYTKTPCLPIGTGKGFLFCAKCSLCFSDCLSTVYCLTFSFFFSFHSRLMVDNCAGARMTYKFETQSQRKAKTLNVFKNKNETLCVCVCLCVCACVCVCVRGCMCVCVLDKETKN